MLHFSSSFEAEIPVKILQAYFCTGDPFWPLELNSHENNAIFKGSVIMAHFLICGPLPNHAYTKLPGYRSKLMNAALDTTLGLQTANLAETKVCVNKKLSCLTFEHMCGPQKLLNFREMLQYFRDLTKNLPGSDHGKLHILL